MGDLSKHLRSLIRVKDAADGRVKMVSNQGQAMDGFSELANYRSLVDKIKKDIGYIDKSEELDEKK